MTNVVQKNQYVGSVLAQLDMYDALKQRLLLAGNQLNRPEPEVVHQLRVFCKRVRAEKKFLRPKRIADGAAASAKKLGALLSGIRDHQVLLDTLERLLRGQPEGTLRGLQVELQQLQGQENLPYKALAEVLDSLSRELHQLTSSGGDSFITRKSSHKSEQLSCIAFRLMDAEAFHCWRKSVKKEYYRGLIQGSECPDLEHLRKLGSKLGKLHDLHQLLAVTEKCCPECLPGLQKLVKAPVEALLDSIRKVSDQLYR